MGQAAFQSGDATHSVPATRRWHNHLPGWVLQEPGFTRLQPSIRQTLQAIANAANPPDSEGSLLGAFGGQGLLSEAGCSGRTFWRHLGRLEALGFVVVLGHGGMIGSRAYGNQYGVPGCRGLLDQRRCSRRMMRMVRSDDGIYRPEIIEPGGQVSLPFRHAAPGPVARRDTAAVSNCHGGSDKMTHPPCQDDTPPSMINTLVKQDHDHGASAKQVRGKKPRLRHVRDGDLEDMDRLLELHRHAVNNGLASGGEGGFLDFVAAAEHARRVGDQNPCGLFASIVNNGRWLYSTQADEEAAHKRIKAHWEEHGGAPH